MFLLDYSAYNEDYVPNPGGWRYGTLIVRQNNVEQWMNALAGEIPPEQLNSVYRDSPWGLLGPLKIVFVIDFDAKVWVGSNWQHDQEALDEYQPADWFSDEDDVMKYLPPEIRSIWDK